MVQDWKYNGGDILESVLPQLSSLDLSQDIKQHKFLLVLFCFVLLCFVFYFLSQDGINWFGCIDGYFLNQRSINGY